MEELFLVQENDFIINITFAWEGALAIAKRKMLAAWFLIGFQPTFLMKI